MLKRTVERGAGARDLLQQLIGVTEDGSRMAEVHPHPFRRRQRSRLGGNPTRGQLVLRFPCDNVLVTLAAVVQVTASRGENSMASSKPSPSGPCCRPSDSGHLRPESSVAMAPSQCATCVSRSPPGPSFRLGSRWKMVLPKRRWRVRVTSAEPLHQLVGLARHELRQDFLAQPLEQRRFAIRKRQSSSEMVNSTLSRSKRAQSSSVRVVGLTRRPMSHIFWQMLRTGSLALARAASDWHRKSKSTSECGNSAAPAEAANRDQGTAFISARGKSSVPKAVGQLVYERRAFAMAAAPSRSPQSRAERGRTPDDRSRAVRNRPSGWAWFS